MSHVRVLASAALAATLLAAGAAPGSVHAEDPVQAAPARRAERVAPRAPPPRRDAEPEVRPAFEEHLPAPLLHEGPRGLLWWQWGALPLVVIVAVVLGALLGWVTRRVLGHLAARTQTTWDDLLLERVAGPFTALWAIGVVTALEPWLVLPAGFEGMLDRVLRAATYLVVFWAGFRSVNVAFAIAAEAPWTRANASLAGLLPLGRKIAQALLLVLGVVSVLNELGFQVASLLAGVGIGGIALALAAQKTVENLFGSISIGVDQPFRVGDYVRLGDGTVGTVETIGMRSTRIRTLERTIVTLPNGKLADMPAETFAVRDRIRLLANLGLSYATTAAQLRDVLAGIEARLRAHPRIWPDLVSVRFTAFNDSTLNVEVSAWFQTADWNEFTRIRQELFIQFMEVVERAGASFAFPTRTVRVERSAPARDGASAAQLGR
jgi:MscS family membrane protein